MPKRDIAIIAAKLTEAHGNVSAAARNLGVARRTVYRRITNSKQLQAVLADARETMLDNAESALYRKVIDGEGWAVCFLLKTQGKARGYIEKVQTEHSGQVGVTLSWADFVREAGGDGQSRSSSE